MKTTKSKFVTIISLILLAGAVIYTIGVDPELPVYKSSGYTQEWLSVISI